MKATSRLRPSASSPCSVAGPSARTSPSCTTVALVHHRPLVDAGRLVGAAGTSAADRRPRTAVPSSWWRDHDAVGRRSESTIAVGARQDDGARVRAARPSMPVRTKRAPRSAPAAPPGAACWNPSARGWRRRSPGTGSAPAATETICFGETSTRSPGRSAPGEVACLRTETRSSEPVLRVARRVGLGDDQLVLLHGGQVVQPSCTWPFSTRRYGVSMKPYSLTWA